MDLSLDGVVDFDGDGDVDVAARALTLTPCWSPRRLLVRASMFAGHLHVAVAVKVHVQVHDYD